MARSTPFIASRLHILPLFIAIYFHDAAPQTLRAVMSYEVVMGFAKNSDKPTLAVTIKLYDDS